MTPLHENQLMEYVDAAIAGNVDALEHLLIALKDPLFRLALRMLGNFADAEDATQEVLIKITTALSAFERRSSIRTWAFRVAVNHLRDLASRRAPTFESFDAVAEQLEKGIAATADFAIASHPDPVSELEAREVGLHCMQGILMCLDVDERLAFVLSEVLDLDTANAAKVANISAVAYRQRVSRARRRLEAFMGAHCGLINADVPCSCARQAQALRRARNGKPIPIKFARGGDPAVADEIQQARVEISRLQRVALVFRASPEWSAPDGLVGRIRELLKSSPLLANGWRQ
ncbi:MAG: hypothetical protein A2W18_06190 [Candidatus Muproteobacteria bacterium RBG_16_60_9]|uniref:RNA polymerase sigma-70 region 2 domain-containing protein n=1 Tax=Candidatus Muproteobacteria bacterium RBG_16_60_9 TaxID=1817755 RepID=A0A1F6VHL0_9PROT|nr:MAG: hypothetical protein A2W18_06190 [Candidatus Muproteobacteria bacterium RBG_16_60_9]